MSSSNLLAAALHGVISSTAKPPPRLITTSPSFEDDENDSEQNAERYDCFGPASENSRAGGGTNMNDHCRTNDDNNNSDSKSPHQPRKFNASSLLQVSPGSIHRLQLPQSGNFVPKESLDLSDDERSQLESGIPSPRRSDRLRSRRASHPVSLYTKDWGNPQSGMSESLRGLSPSTYTRRRLSQVSEVVARRLSTTIGWRTTSATTVVVEAKSLCGQYVRARLRRSGVVHRKLGLQRLRSVMNLTTSYGSCDVFTHLNQLGKELELRHPKLYHSVCRQICRTLTSEDAVHKVFTSIAQEMFRDDTITWGRIVALYAIAGALAVDCVHQGHVDYVMCLIESLGLFIERDIATWILQQGGWGTLTSRFKPPSSYPSLNAVLSTAAACFVLALVIYIFWYLRS